MQEKDIETVSRLYRDMYAQQKKMGMVMDFNGDEIQEMLAVQLKSRFFTLLVLEDRCETKGFAVGSIVRAKGKYKLQKGNFLAFINDIYVSPDKRNSGYGKALLKALEDRFEEQGIGYIELNVLEGNEEGRSFWKKNGYNDVIRVMYKNI